MKTLNKTLNFQSYSLVIILIMSVLASCDKERDLSDEGVIITPHPLLEHWHGPDGVLSRFGPNSEVGALMHYGEKTQDNFIIVDGTGKQFIRSVNGELEGPYPITSLFTDSTGITGLTDGGTTFQKLYCRQLDSFGGIESAVYAQGVYGITSMTCVGKNGTHLSLIDVSIVANPLTFSQENGPTKDLALDGAVEAMLHDDRISTRNTCYSLFADKSGMILVNDTNGTSTPSEHWPGIPSNRIEAMTYFQEPLGTTAHHTVIILGEDGEIPNGHMLYMISEYNNKTETRLVDLSKEY